MKKLIILPLLTFCANIIYAQTTYLSVPDTRSVSTTPASYNLSFEPHFKAGAILGLPDTYYTILGIRGWTDNTGGKSHELAFGENGINYRSGYEPAWGNWRTLLASNENGNYGIGTTNPLAPLHIAGGATMTGSWNRTSILEANFPVQLFSSGQTKYGGVGYDHTSGMFFWVNAANSDVSSVSPAMGILNNGNLGLGTTTPAEKLDINGNVVWNGYKGGNVRALNLGYSGSNYGGIGYNVDFTTTTGVFNRPLNDQSSYLEFANGGFRFYGNSYVANANGVNLGGGGG